MREEPSLETQQHSQVKTTLLSTYEVGDSLNFNDAVKKCILSQFVSGSVGKSFKSQLGKLSRRQAGDLFPRHLFKLGGKKQRCARVEGGIAGVAQYCVTLRCSGTSAKVENLVITSHTVVETTCLLCFGRHKRLNGQRAHLARCKQRAKWAAGDLRSS